MTTRPGRTLGSLGAAALTTTMFAARLTACTDASPSDEELRQAARSAAETYVAAIAAQDQETADAMTADHELAVPDVDELVDVRDALAEASQPISDTWLQDLGFRSSGSTTYVHFQVSYLIGDVVGAGTIELSHLSNDPMDSWTVLDGLLVSGVAFADPDSVETFTIGGVELQPPSTSNARIWGYPGAYLSEANQTIDDVAVEPVTVLLGDETVPRWDDPWPRLEGTSEED